MPSIDWARYALSATSVLLLMSALLWWLRRRKNAMFPRLEARRIQVLEVCPLGLKHKMMLVQADQQMLLVSVNPNGLHTLHAWTASPNEQSSTLSQGAGDAV